MKCSDDLFWLLIWLFCICFILIGGILFSYFKLEKSFKWSSLVATVFLSFAAMSTTLEPQKLPGQSFIINVTSFYIISYCSNSENCSQIAIKLLNSRLNIIWWQYKLGEGQYSRSKTLTLIHKLMDNRH